MSSTMSAGAAHAMDKSTGRANTKPSVQAFQVKEYNVDIFL